MVEYVELLAYTELCNLFVCLFFFFLSFLNRNKGSSILNCLSSFELIG